MIAFCTGKDSVGLKVKKGARFGAARRCTALIVSRVGFSVLTL